MINKMEVGHRIQSLRKQDGLSQTELGEKLGISTQAVSKWETGSALPDVEVLLDLSRLFGLTINELLQGKDIFPAIASREYVWDNGIAYFRERAELPQYVEWGEALRREKWVERNWHEIKKGPEKLSYRQKAIAQMEDHGGIALEIGTGPGGGFMPFYLQANPYASIIISDISPAVVEEWKAFLDKELQPPNVHYALLDNCDLPFLDNSLDIVSTAGGIGNIEGGSIRTALMECYRVLKPGGMLVLGEGFVTQDMLRALPEHAQKVLLEQRPDIFDDYNEILLAAGFQSIDTTLTGGSDTDGDESLLADLARELGINIHFTGCLRFCMK